MDYRSLVQCFAVPCCVLSVEKTADNGFGEIRIVCANERYRQVMDGYHDNMIYHELVPKDLNFEDFCYRSAVLGQHMHAYVEVMRLQCWMEETILPLESDEPGMGYCLFTFEVTPKAEPERMAKVSVETAEAVIRACITLMGTEDIQERVGTVLSDLREQTGSFDCRVMLIDQENQTATNFCERHGALSDHRDGDGIIPYEIVATWEDMLGETNSVIIKNEKEMALLEEKNPAWAESLRRHHVTSVVLLPLRQGNKVFGFLHASNFNVDKVVQVKELVELMSFFLSSEIANYLLVNRLEKLSQADGLTELRNRRAMSQRIAQLTEDRAEHPFGIVNLDLNGLKVVNDREGHSAGDQKLVQAAEVLREVFSEEEIYRTGGDEFLIITSDARREDFERRVEQLRQNVAHNDEVSFAMGTYWSDGSEDVTASFRHADESMYTDKKAFYASHPEKRRDGYHD